MFKFHCIWYGVLPSTINPGALAAALRRGYAACGICHGPMLRGLGEVPRIAGQDPIHIFRVAGEFILTPPLVFRIGRDNAAASDRA
jgi:hypothetical protein